MKGGLLEMRSQNQPGRERVLIDFPKTILNDVSNKARKEGKTLSSYVKGFILSDLRRISPTVRRRWSLSDNY